MQIAGIPMGRPNHGASTSNEFREASRAYPWGGAIRRRDGGETAARRRRRIAGIPMGRPKHGTLTRNEFRQTSRAYPWGGAIGPRDDREKIATAPRPDTNLDERRLGQKPIWTSIAGIPFGRRDRRRDGRKKKATAPRRDTNLDDRFFDRKKIGRASRAYLWGGAIGGSTA